MLKLPLLKLKLKLQLKLKLELKLKLKLKLKLLELKLQIFEPTYASQLKNMRVSWLNYAGTPTHTHSSARRIESSRPDGQSLERRKQEQHYNVVQGCVSSKHEARALVFASHGGSFQGPLASGT